MTAARAWRVVHPVEHDEWQTANHEDDSHHEEDGSPNFLRWVHRFGLDQTKVERRGQDKDEHCSSRGPDEAKDVSDGGHEDHQEIIEDQDPRRDEQMSDPAELSAAEQESGDRRTDRE